MNIFIINSWINKFLLNKSETISVIKINNKELYNLNTNIFSIDNKTIVSNTSFKKINTTLESLGYKVEKTKYDEISKFGGLFRCTTLPIERKA